MITCETSSFSRYSTTLTRIATFNTVEIRCVSYVQYVCMYIDMSPVDITIVCNQISVGFYPGRVWVTLDPDNLHYLYLCPILYPNHYPLSLPHILTLPYPMSEMRSSQKSEKRQRVFRIKFSSRRQCNAKHNECHRRHHRIRLHLLSPRS